MIDAACSITAIQVNSTRCELEWIKSYEGIEHCSQTFGLKCTDSLLHSTVRIGCDAKVLTSIFIRTSFIWQMDVWPLCVTKRGIYLMAMASFHGQLPRIIRKFYFRPDLRLDFFFFS